MNESGVGDDWVSDRSFFARDPRIVGPALLGLDLVVRPRHGARSGPRRVRIVEVEAYCGAEDPAAHTYRGPTPRTTSMFGPAGHLYVYRSYGIHHCANVVCGDVGEGVAVLLRAAEPRDGLPAMYAARGRAAARDRDLCSGPGKLCQALAIDLEDDGADLVAGTRVRIEAGVPVSDVVQTTRVGISVARTEPWRWYDAGSPHVSRR